MTTITIDKCVYKIHPIYDLYAGSKDGRFVNIIKRVPHIGNKNCGDCYFKCRVREHGQSGQKNYYVHRFIWECFNGVIPDGKEIDHINNNKEDNHLRNLQLLTPKQNCKKAAKNRDYSFNAKNYENRKCVEAINIKTNEKSYYYSMHAAHQHLSINSGTIKKICEGLYRHKSGKSKKDGCSYTFQYIKEEDLPENHIKSANKRPKRVSDEDKRKHYLEWRNKEFECLNCGKMSKNNNKYNHEKRCNSSQKQQCFWPPNMTISTFSFDQTQNTMLFIMFCLNNNSLHNLFLYHL